MNPTLDERLVRIEGHLTHVERLNEELNTVVTEQSRLIAKLQTQLRRITETVEASELDRIRATNPRPPHSG